MHKHTSLAVQAAGRLLLLLLLQLEGLHAHHLRHCLAVQREDASPGWRSENPEGEFGETDSFVFAIFSINDGGIGLSSFLSSVCVCVCVCIHVYICFLVFPPSSGCIIAASRPLSNE